jgi:response regulator of citrate/malate metabolism
MPPSPPANTRHRSLGGAHLGPHLTTRWGGCSTVMSKVDNQASVAQCLHLGAVDYLVKPLRRNELNNLWAHVWRRRMVRPRRDSSARCGW